MTNETSNTTPKPKNSSHSRRKRTQFLGYLAWTALLAGESALLFEIPLKSSIYRELASSTDTFSYVAKLRDKRKQVFIKTNDDRVWHPLKKGATLTPGQKIMTSENSRAIFELRDGSLLIMHQNSELVTSGVEPNRLTIELKKGTLQKKTSEQPGEAQTLVLKTGETSTVIRDRAEVFVSTTSADSTIRVLKGESTVSVQVGEEFQTVHLSTGEEIKASRLSLDLPKKKKINFALLYPVEGNFMPSRTSQTIRFSLDIPHKKLSEYPILVEVSADPLFKGKTITRRIPASFPALHHIETRIPLPKSKSQQDWYWRVRSKKENLASETVRFTLAPGQLPQLKYPIPLSKASKGEKVEFIWSPIDGVDAYEIEILSRGRKTRRWKLESIIGTRFETNTIPKGTYFWRVRGTSESGHQTDWSHLRTLIVSHNDKN